MATKNLPNEVVLHILRNVLKVSGFKGLFNVRRLCKQWNSLVPVVVQEELSKLDGKGWNLLAAYLDHKLKWVYLDPFQLTYNDESKSIYGEFQEFPLIPVKPYICFALVFEHKRSGRKHKYKDFWGLPWPQTKNPTEIWYNKEGNGVCFRRELGGAHVQVIGLKVGAIKFLDYLDQYA
ncbi:17850_t:CDS:2 [Acaulospora morrowiae]|uniref:17850_t:CDS:1 n=1 Tax=Acaulospora morrowiae TaxID=94023 RepID=A0A9N8VDY5_9GLOM|nr:17850_t:CDS:2 [Acaulospora morrowiae]